MEAVSLDDIIALNDQLGLLAQAGVPLELGLGGPKEASARLDKINATVARRVQAGESLPEAIVVDEALIPATYRGLLQWGLGKGDLRAGLDSVCGLGESTERIERKVDFTLFYPLLVCTLAGMGLIGLCLFYVPTVEGIYQQLGFVPGRGLTALLWMRRALPYWTVFPPAAFLALIVWLFYEKTTRGSTGRLPAALVGRIPSARQSVDRQRCAVFADAVADLLESGMPLQEALPIASATCGDRGLSEGAGWLAGELKQGRIPDKNAPEVRVFPPLLCWALFDSEPVAGQISALRTAAGGYRELAAKSQRRLELVAAPVACAVLGGGAVLLYGLAVFLPAIEMLKTLAQ
jgi:general secretion pathway protein F